MPRPRRHSDTAATREMGRGWNVRLGTTPFHLGPGTWTIGRAAHCELRADDFCLSRRHAVLTIDEEGVRIRDEQSSHGTYRGDERLDGEVALRAGDVVMLGATVLSVVGPAGERAAGPHATETSEPDSRQADSTGQFEVDGALVETLSEHVAARDYQAARVVLERLFQLIRTRETLPMGADPSVVRAACAEAIRLADQTRSMGWLDETVDVHRVRPRVMSATTVQQLSQVLAAHGWPPPPALNGYVRGLRARAERFDGYERTVLERLEALIAEHAARP